MRSITPSVGWGPRRRVLVEMRTPVYKAVLGPVCDAIRALPDVTLDTSEYPERIRPLIGDCALHQPCGRRVDPIRPLSERGPLGGGRAFAAAPTVSTFSTGSQAGTIWIT